MVDFRCAEYVDGKIVGSDEIRMRIVEIGIRKVARETKIDSKTIMKIVRGEPVKPVTLQRAIEFVDEKRMSCKS
jgi:hypothetical protein